MSEQPEDYITDALEMKTKYSDYEKYFMLDADGTLYTDPSFAQEIKHLKGAPLHNLYRYIYGEIDDGLLSDIYKFKDERECTYNYIPSKLRWDVYERDNFTCQVCGSRRYLSIDHIYPKSKGGKTTMENCQTLCQHCNSKKGTK